MSKQLAKERPFGAEPRFSAWLSCDFYNCCQSWPFIPHHRYLVSDSALGFCQLITACGSDARNRGGHRRFPGRGEKWQRESWQRTVVATEWREQTDLKCHAELLRYCVTLQMKKKKKKPVNSWTQFSHAKKNDGIDVHTHTPLTLYGTELYLLFCNRNIYHLIAAFDRLRHPCHLFPSVLAT